MKKIDEAIAKTVCLISYYADLQNKLTDKLNLLTVGNEIGTVKLQRDPFPEG